MSWKELVTEVLTKLGGEATLKDLTQELKNHPLRPDTRTWKATIRRVVRQYKIFEPFKTEKGYAAYRLVQIPEPEFTQEPGDEDPHGKQQGMLLKLGRLCGYETYTNATDRSIRRMRGIPIAKFATVRSDTETLRGLPLERIRNTDVIWMDEDAEGLYPRYAFEVEQSTKVKSGLLRLLKIPLRYQTRLYIIGKGDEESRLFKRYMRDAPFREHSERFQFHRYDEVEAFYEGGLQFDRERRRFSIELR